MVEASGAQKRIVLVGATGFIGYHLQRELLACGYDLSAVVRPRSKRKTHVLANVIVHEAALTDAHALRQIVRDADIVIYAAGSVRGGSAADFAAANIDGVTAIAAAAVDSMRVPQLLLISSLAASCPHLSDYALSKFAGEQRLREVPGLHWTILRPPAVYGPGDREMRPLLASIRRGLAIVVGPRGQCLSLLYVADLARAVATIVAQADVCRGQVFELDDGQRGAYSWPQIIAAARGWLPPVRLRIPQALLVLFAYTNVFLAKLFGYAPMLTLGKARELSQPGWLCNNQALTAATGWLPQVNLRDGIRATFQPREAKQGA